MSVQPHRWAVKGRSVVVVLLTTLIGAVACGAATDAAPPVVTDPPTEETALGRETVAEPTGDRAPSSDTTSLADLVAELPPAPIGAPTPEPSGPQPTGLSIDALGIATAPVISVGVESNGDMEVPPADEVGWYQYGPAPGDEGSAVLAAHIAYDGQDGVFRRLDQLPLGSIIAVAYDDGSTRDFVAVDRQQYDKQALPKESVFARRGEPSLVLITCGGNFNRNLRSYDDNVVVYAEPVDR